MSPFGVDVPEGWTTLDNSHYQFKARHPTRCPGIDYIVRVVSSGPTSYLVTLEETRRHNKDRVQEVEGRQTAIDQAETEMRYRGW